MSLFIGVIVINLPRNRCHLAQFENVTIKHTKHQRDHSEELCSMSLICTNLFLCLELLHSENQMPANQNTDSLCQENCT